MLLINFLAGLFIRVRSVAAAVDVEVLPEIKKAKIQSNLSTFPLCKFISQCRASEWETVTLAVIRQSGRESWTFKPGANLTSPSSTVIVHQDRELRADAFIKASRTFWREEMLKNKLCPAQLIDGAGRGAQIKG